MAGRFRGPRRASRGHPIGEAAAAERSDTMPRFMRESPGGGGLGGRPDAAADGPQVPKGLFVRCDGCSEVVYGRAVRENLEVCPRCDYHLRVSARDRIEMLADDGEYRILSGGVRSNDPLEFQDRLPYRERLRKGAAATGLEDAILVARLRIERTPVVLAVMEYGFIGGSMGVVVGEQITRAVEVAGSERVPLVVVSCSGGARMQEGALSLMQMAKISAALAMLDDQGLPYLSVLTHPTTGGVTASYAMLGDLNLAEPGALIGFAGPRVIQQTIRGELPEGFQRSEFLLEHGMLDRVVHRRDLRRVLGAALRFLYDPAAEPSFAEEAAAVAEPAAEPAFVRAR